MKSRILSFIFALAICALPAAAQFNQVVINAGDACNYAPGLGIDTAGNLYGCGTGSGRTWISPANATLTFTNKTFDTAGTGNSFLINGVAVTANTGTGAVARATNAVFVTPTLGVATFSNLISATANPASAGIARFAAADALNWRNTANAADIGFANQGAAAAGNGNIADVLLYGSGSLGGLQANAFVAGSAAPANSGRFRLSNTDAMSWRNNANAADLAFTKTGAASGATPADTLDASAFSEFKAAYLKSSNQTLQVITSNFTTSATTLAAAGVVTGLNFTAPASVASNWSFDCTLVYSQATAAAANLIGVTTAVTAPTSMLGFADVYTSLAGASVNGSAVISTSTSTTLVTATPSAFGAIGTTADMFQIRIWGTAEFPSNASAPTVGIAVASGNASDALTVYRGSKCYWY